MPLQLTFVIVLALIFDFLNAVHGSSNIVATMISSRAFRPLNALLLAGIAEFIGPFLFGVAVARTIGVEIVDTNVVTLKILMACMIGSILWSLLTWFLGLPSSTSHGLVGGLIGATIVGAGPSAIRLQGLLKTLIGLFGTPLIGFGLGFVLLRLILFLAVSASPRINEFFKASQLLTSVVLASSHSSNDAQKAMGVIVLSMVISGSLSSFTVPPWVIAATAMGMTLGTLFGGLRLIRTLGGKFYKIRPVDSFTAQSASVLVILGSSLIGWPVSTTQVVSSAIVGVGSSERLGKVRWNVAAGIVLAWVVTLPVTAGIAAGVYMLLVRFMP